MAGIGRKTGVSRIAGCALALAGLQACKPAGPPPLTPVQACLATLDPVQGVDLCKTAIAQNQQDAALRRRMGLLRLKGHSLPSARQSYQIARSLDAKDAEAQFGLGLTLEAIGEPKANVQKSEAAARDPTVVDRFRKYGIPELDLMTFDTAPAIVAVPGPGKFNPLLPRLSLARELGVDVKCQVGLKGQLHDCNVITPLQPGQEPYGEAAKKILVMTKVKPAYDKGAPIADAPIVLTFVFEPT